MCHKCKCISFLTHLSKRNLTVSFPVQWETSRLCEGKTVGNLFNNSVDLPLKPRLLQKSWHFAQLLQINHNKLHVI